MARPLRVEFGGAVYHIMARGNQGHPICLDEPDRKMGLATLGQACDRTGWRIHAWVSMSNHFHLLLETPEANLVRGMKWLQGTYTQRYNARHRKRGHLFQGRYRAVPVETGEGIYFQTVSTYIHLNPARAKAVLAGGRRESHGGEVRRAHDLEQARPMVEWGLGQLGMKREELARSPKGREEKQVLAWWLHGHTSVSRRWIAERLAMGYESRVSQAVSWVEATRARPLVEMKRKLREYRA